MTRNPRPPPLNRRAPKMTSSASFDPVVFLATGALGRDISAHAKNEIIFAQGDDADSVFYIKKGRIKVAVVSKDGKEAVIALLGPDEFCGEGCLIGQPKRLATASALPNARRCGSLRPSSSASFMMSLHFHKCSCPISCCGMPASKRIW